MRSSDPVSAENGTAYALPRFSEAWAARRGARTGLRGGSGRDMTGSLGRDKDFTEPGGPCHGPATAASQAGTRPAASRPSFAEARQRVNGTVLG